METECYPCIPMQSAVTGSLSGVAGGNAVLQVKQEQPDDDEDNDEVDNGRKSGRTKTASPAHSLLNRSIKKEPVQLIYTSQHQQQLQISLPTGAAGAGGNRLQQSQFANSSSTSQQARGINRITTRVSSANTKTNF